MHKQILLMILLTSTVTNAGYGDPAEGFPNWRERSLIVLINACRVAPQEFRDKYLKNNTVLTPQKYPPVDPLYWNIDLNRSARAHAIEMATDCGLTHNSCDGTSPQDRIRSYYKKGTTWGENIAEGTADPLSTMVLFLLENTKSPVPDGSNDGHRANIMNSSFKEIGCGFSIDPKKQTPYWDQDFGGGTSEYASFPIQAASHFFFNNGEITFLANAFVKVGTINKVTVVLDSQSHPMTLFMGSANRGVYSFTMNKPNGCLGYYFTVELADGTSKRYPENQSLLTYGVSGCTDDYSTTVIKRGFSRNSSDQITQKYSLIVRDLQGKLLYRGSADDFRKANYPQGIFIISRRNSEVEIQNFMK